MNTTSFGSMLFGLLVLAACGGSSTAIDASSTSPRRDTPSAPGASTGTVRDALSFTAPCNASACGDVPASSASSTPACQPSDGGCAWSDPGADGTVSYRTCDDSQCGPAPNPSVCPAGTTFTGAQCGSENEQACAWRSTCVPPRSTKGCPTVDGCGPAKPEIGVVCKDGSAGDLACMLLATGKCGWQPTCE